MLERADLGALVGRERIEPRAEARGREIRMPHSGDAVRVARDQPTPGAVAAKNRIVLDHRAVYRIGVGERGGGRQVVFLHRVSLPAGWIHTSFTTTVPGVVRKRS